MQYGDVAGAARVLETISDDMEAHQKRGMAARRIPERLRWPNIAQAYSTLYRDLKSGPANLLEVVT